MSCVQQQTRGDTCFFSCHPPLGRHSTGITHPQVLYDKSLEMRILLQKVMVGAAALPRTDSHALAVQQHPALSER